ncbi:MAG: Cof-type HAD-IIB family hydrolase [Ruminococcus sp.]|nr:Cof-type HAD-IIB family hydrolase [Ruminococcus sp.]
MKTLYISDLDGTLLNSAAELSDNTVSTINRLVDEGMYFTFATARTLYSAASITERLKINVPCILNNGAGIYDPNGGTYVKKACIPINVSKKIISAFRKNDVRCFLFKFAEGRLVTCYDKITEELMQSYVNERRTKFDQPFMECADILDELDETAVYINSCGEFEKLRPVRNSVGEIEGAGFEFYEDTYTKKWYLETFSAAASKGSGIKYLRETYGFERVVAFGDNLNDLSMFEQADVKIAVENGNSRLKEEADVVIKSNDDDGVAIYLGQHRTKTA